MNHLQDTAKKSATNNNPNNRHYRDSRALAVVQNNEARDGAFRPLVVRCVCYGSPVEGSSASTMKCSACRDPSPTPNPVFSTVCLAEDRALRSLSTEVLAPIKTCAHAEKGLLEYWTHLTDYRSLLCDLNLVGEDGLLVYCMRSSACFSRWEPYNLHDVTHVSWIGSVPCRSCTASHSGRLGFLSVRCV